MPTAKAPERSRGNDAALIVRENAQIDWLKKTLAEPAHVEVYEAALEQARGRADHCPSDRCREIGQSRRDARLDFAEGQIASVDELPFDSGQFARSQAGYSGPIRILPLIDGRAMMVVSLSLGGKPACALDGVMTKDDKGETWTVASLDEGMPMLVLTPVGKTAFDIAYAYPKRQRAKNAYCVNKGASIEGRYAIPG